MSKCHFLSILDILLSYQDSIIKIFIKILAYVVAKSYFKSWHCSYFLYNVKDLYY